MFTELPSGLYFLLSVLFRAFLAGVLSGFLHSTFFFHFFYPIHFLMFPRVFRYVFILLFPCDRRLPFVLPGGLHFL